MAAAHDPLNAKARLGISVFCGTALRVYNAERLGHLLLSKTLGAGRRGPVPCWGRELVTREGGIISKTLGARAMQNATGRAYAIKTNPPQGRRRVRMQSAPSHCLNAPSCSKKAGAHAARVACRCNFGCAFLWVGV